MRETRGETGLRVRATSVIGSRIHPRTGVLIAYVAAVLASRAEVKIREMLKDFADREDCELAEVR